MANTKKSIDELKKSNKTLDKKKMDKVKGGKRRDGWGRRGCGNITPQ
ncbi:MAG: hypothetical protein WBA17_05685 [Saprospiraceae bacterium]